MKKLLLYLTVVMSLLSTTAFAIGPTHFEDTTTYSTAINPLVPTCLTNQVLTYTANPPPATGGSYSCVTNEPPVPCVPPKVIGSVTDPNGVVHQTCIQPVNFPSSCLPGQVVTQTFANAPTTCAPATPAIFCVGGTLQGYTAAGTPICGAAIVPPPACPPNMGLTGNGANINCQSLSQLITLSAAQLFANNSDCIVGTAEVFPFGPGVPPGVGLFNAECISACDLYCIRTLNFNGGTMVDSSGGNGTCLCSR